MRKKLFICALVLTSTLGLFSCSSKEEREDDTNLPSGDDDKDDQDDDTPITPEISEEEKIFSTLTTLKNTPDYTLDSTDGVTHFVQYFNKNCWTYDFDDSYKLVSYIEDDIGIFPLSVSKEDSSYKLDYYEVNDYGENLHGLYENVTYSFSDLTLNKSDYKFDESSKRLYVNDLNSEDTLVLFSLLGYDPNATDGSSIKDVQDIYFTFIDETTFTLNITFDPSTSFYGEAICKITNIGSTIQPEAIEALLNDGVKGYERVKSGDVLFEYLANLKNLRNFTSEVKSDYNNEYSNYTLVSYYMKNAYYSVSSRASEGDLGYYQDENGIVTLLVDGVTGKTIIGKNYLEDQYGTPLKDLYEDAVYSFASTTWDYTFEARVKDESTYIIDDTDYVAEAANMTDAYTLRLSFTNIELSYDKEKNEYNFKFNMIDDETIYMRIYDIGTTVIGDLEI